MSNMDYNRYLEELNESIKKNNKMLELLLKDKYGDFKSLLDLEEENKSLKILLEDKDRDIDFLNTELNCVNRTELNNYWGIKRENKLLKVVIKHYENQNKSLRNEIKELKNKSDKKEVILNDVNNVEDFQGNAVESENKTVDNNEDISINKSGEVLSEERKQKEDLERALWLKHKPSNFWEKNAYARKQLLDNYEKYSIDRVMTMWNYKTKRSLLRVIDVVKAIEEKEKQGKVIEKIDIKPMDVSHIQYNSIGVKKGECNLSIILRVFKANHGLAINADDADGSKYWIEITGDTILFKDEFRRVANEKIKNKDLSSIRIFYKPNKFNIPAWHIVCTEEELDTAFDILYNTNPFGYEVNRKVFFRNK